MIINQLFITTIKSTIQITNHFIFIPIISLYYHITTFPNSITTINNSIFISKDLYFIIIIKNYFTFISYNFKNPTILITNPTKSKPSSITILLFNLSFLSHLISLIYLINLSSNSLKAYILILFNYTF